MSRHGITTADALNAQRAQPAIIHLLGAYTELTKIRLSLLVLWTTAVGFVLAAEQVGGFDSGRFLWTLLGTACAAWSASAMR